MGFSIHFNILIILIIFDSITSKSVLTEYQINEKFFVYEIQMLNNAEDNKDGKSYGNKCHQVQLINLTSSDNIDMVFFNDDNSSPKLSYIDHETPVHQQSLVVIDKTILYLFEFKNSDEYDKTFLKV